METVYFDGMSNAQVAMSLLSGTAMLKDPAAINALIALATSADSEPLTSDRAEYDAAYTELEIIGKELEQTSRRLIHKFAEIRSNDLAVIPKSVLSDIMKDFADTLDFSDEAAEEFGTSDAFTYSQFMSFLEFVDKDEEAEHPDFAIVRDIQDDALDILDLVAMVLPEGYHGASSLIQ